MQRRLESYEQAIEFLFGRINYERVSVYFLDPQDQERLLSTHAECVFNWATQDGWPMGVIMSYLWKDGRVWLTAGANRHRIAAVRRDPRVSVVVTSTGTPLGPGKSITIKGRVTVHEDRETKDWFYPEFSAHLHAGKPELAEYFSRTPFITRLLHLLDPRTRRHAPQRFLPHGHRRRVCR